MLTALSAAFFASRGWPFSPLLGTEVMSLFLVDFQLVAVGYVGWRLWRDRGAFVRRAASREGGAALLDRRDGCAAAVDGDVEQEAGAVRAVLHEGNARRDLRISGVARGLGARATGGLRGEIEPERRPIAGLGLDVGDDVAIDARRGRRTREGTDREVRLTVAARALQKIFRRGERHTKHETDAVYPRVVSGQIHRLGEGCPFVASD